MPAAIAVPAARRFSPSELPSLSTARPAPDSRKAHSSSGSWLPATTGSWAFRASWPVPNSVWRLSQAAMTSRGNKSLPVTRLTGMTLSLTNS
jgi:hypothetical protein